MNSETIRFSKNPITFWLVSLPSFLWQIVAGETQRLYHLFSIPELSRTLFAPWKRDEYSTENLSLDQRFHVIAMNMVSRLIAFFMRSVTIIFGVLTISVWFLLGIQIIMLQILLPAWVVLIVIFGLR